MSAPCWRLLNYENSACLHVTREGEEGSSESHLLRRIHSIQRVRPAPLRGVLHSRNMGGGSALAAQMFSRATVLSLLGLPQRATSPSVTHRKIRIATDWVGGKGTGDAKRPTPALGHPSSSDSLLSHLLPFPLSPFTITPHPHDPSSSHSIPAGHE